MAGETISTLPTVRISGLDMPALTQNLVRMRMREAAGGLSSLELVLSDVISTLDGGVVFGGTARSPTVLGAPIKVFTGDVQSPREIFDGMITAVEAEVGPETSSLFTVLAEDRLFQARKTRKTRTFTQVSPADLVKKIATDLSLTPQVRDGLDAPTGDWTQMNESDLAFLRRVLERFDADVQAMDDKLMAGPNARDPRTQVTLTLGENLLRARITADLADQAAEVRVASFDPATGQPVTATATDGQLGPGTGKNGAAVLRDKFSPWREHAGHLGPMTSAEANKVARALYGRRARRFVRIDGAAQGDGNIRVGTHATIAGVNPLFANIYVLTEITHRFDLETGYLTEFLGECACMGGS
jgi:phage protein D